MEAKLYTAQEAADIMGLSIKRMRQIMPSMRCVQVGKRLRVTMGEIVRWQNEQSMTHEPDTPQSRKAARRAEMDRLYNLGLMASKASGGKIPRRK